MSYKRRFQLDAEGARVELGHQLGKLDDVMVKGLWGVQKAIWIRGWGCWAAGMTGRSDVYEDVRVEIGVVYSIAPFLILIMQAAQYASLVVRCCLP